MTPTDTAALVDAIADGPPSPTPAPEDEPWTAQSLAVGAAGTALLHIERAHTGRGTWHQAHAWIRHATAGDISATDATGLYLGAPAIAFVLNAATSPGSSRYEGPLSTIDRHVTAIVHRRTNTAHARHHAGKRTTFHEYDAFYGLTGLGSYLLHRDPGGNALNRVLDYLVTLTRPVRSDDGTALPGWWVEHDPSLKHSDDFPGGHANFGTAHGISGILLLLARAMRRGIAVDGHGEAIATILTWLDRWRQESPRGPWWPEHITLPELRRGATRQQGPARPSWCYGTPGIARAGQLAAIATGDQNTQRAYEKALLACLDDPHQMSRLTDVGLCHGWAGLFQTVWRSAHDAITPALVTTVPTLADALTRHTQATNSRSSGLLEGQAGAALALTTATANAAPTSGWDACLLID